MENGFVVACYSAFFFLMDLCVFGMSFLRRKDSGSQKAFSKFALSVVVLQFFAFNMTAFELGVYECSRAVKGFSYFVVVAFPAVSAYLVCGWLVKLFSLSDLPRSKWVKVSLAFPMIAYVLLCFVSLKTRWVFFMDENDIYHQGALYVIQLAVPYLYLVGIFILLFKEKLTKKNIPNGKIFKFILLYTLPPVMGSGVQMFLDSQGNFSSSGISAALLLCYIGMYMGDAEEHRRIKDLADFNEKLQLVNKQLRLTMMRGELQAKTVAETIRGGFKIGRFDRYFSFKYISEQLAQMMGYTVEEMLDVSGGNMAGLVDKEEVKRQLPAAMALASEGKMFTLNYKVRCQDGSWKHVEERGRVIQSEGAEDEVWSVIVDKDEIVKAETALAVAESNRKRLEEYTNIISNAGMGVWFISIKEGTRSRMRANKKMREIMGVDDSVVSEEDVYDFWFSRIVESEIPSVNNSVAEMCAGKFSENTYQWNHPSKGAVYVRCGGTAQRMVDGVFVLCGYHYDVTDIVNKDKMQQKLLKDALALAEESSRAKTTFLNNMSHDIRTPMNAILGFASLMEKEINNPEKIKDYLAKLKDSGDFLLSLINNVLEMARIESGKSVVEERPTYLRGNTESIMNIFESAAKERNLTISTALDISHEYVYVDMIKMREIIVNLISNAIKYSKPGGHIATSMTEVPCQRSGYAAYNFVVEDDGVGISEEFLPHIFESFARERNSTESKIVGSGLGLPIVKKLVDLMNGKITVESTLGKGSKFTVYLEHRICYEKDVFENAASDSEKSVDLDGLHILLVEDNALNAEIATTLLQDRGVVVDHAGDGCVCMEMLEKAGPGYYDVILMDIQMPRKNGYETTREIRQLPNEALRTIPVVAMTANAFEEDKQKAIDAGMNAHVAKPFDMKVLVSTLATVVK